jgi:hypothetical protein
MLQAACRRTSDHSSPHSIRQRYQSEKSKEGHKEVKQQTKRQYCSRRTHAHTHTQREREYFDAADSGGRLFELHSDDSIRIPLSSHETHTKAKTDRQAKEDIQRQRERREVKYLENFDNFERTELLQLLLEFVSEVRIKVWVVFRLRRVEDAEEEISQSRAEI